MSFSDLAIFLALPVFNMILFFLKDKKRDRRILINTLIGVNILIFISPVLMEVLQNGWSDNFMWESPGGKAIFFYYFLLFPLCLIATIVLAVLRVIAHQNSRREENEEL